MEEEKLKEIMAKPISVYLTFNSQEWIQGPDFLYHNHVVERMRYAHEFMAEAPPEDKPAWEEEEELEEPPADLTEEQLAKYNEDKQKENETHSEETKTLAKRKGYKVFIFGSDFKKTQTMQVKFTWEDKVTQIMPAFYKNQETLAVSIPDLGEEVPFTETPEHLVNVDVSLDG
jgi:hypothetical protein